jgi:Trk-type K+ transport system membrane component
MFDLEPLLVSELSQLAKLVLIASMVLGRLEILVVLSVMTSAVRRA